jgi:hypothetical protein
LNFFTKKVIKYQQKKLAEAEDKLRFHMDKKRRMEKTINPEIKKEIEKEEEMIRIWINNVNKIKHEIKKLQEKKA